MSQGVASFDAHFWHWLWPGGVLRVLTLHYASAWVEQSCRVMCVWTLSNLSIESVVGPMLGDEPGCEAEAHRSPS